ncbi:DegV family protein [Deinococcus deserti]|uniref:DegV family protein n=1 Tax=Deinococcus deserti TaxID=310783 RepID=UPI0001994B69|nr:DegV family protein [Deinococcus deserti]
MFSVHISGELSETVRRAREAAQRLPDPARVRVVDSKLTTAPLAEVALVARAALDAGQTMAQAEQQVHATRAEMSTNFSVASLEYLRCSGRISRGQQVVGNMLNLRPVLHFDQGKLSVIKRLKAPQVLPDMLSSAVQRFGNKPVTVTIVHAGRDADRITELHGAVGRSGLNIKQGRALLLGPVIGAHVGPGTFGVLVRPFHG